MSYPDSNHCPSFPDPESRELRQFSFLGLTPFVMSWCHDGTGVSPAKIQTPGFNSRGRHDTYRIRVRHLRDR